MATMAILAFEVLLRENRKNRMWPKWALNLGSQLFGSNALLFELWATETCVTWEIYRRSPHGHALLALTKWSKSNIQGTKRQFKDMPSSTCLTSLERTALDLNGWGPRFNAHWGYILFYFLFSCSKASDANIAIIANTVWFVKTMILNVSHQLIYHM